MTPLKILIVDDNQDFSESLADILEHTGHQVALAFDGQTAIQKYRRQKFDIIFLDVRLPDMKGMEGFFALRKIDPQVRVTLVTGYSDDQLTREAVHQGVLCVLQKPLHIPELLTFLDQIK